MAAAPEFIPTRPALLCAMAARLSSSSAARIWATGSSRPRHAMRLTIGLASVSSIWPSDSSTTSSITTNTFGAQKISTRTGIGPTRTILAGSGGRTQARSAPSAIGRRIATATGHGVRRMAGRGLDMNRGAGRRITTVVGFITTASGLGVHAASFTGTGVGGVRHSSRLFSTFTSVMTFAGTHCLTTREIRIHVTTVTIGMTAAIIVTIVRDMAGRVDDTIGMMMDHGVGLRVCRAATSVIPVVVDVRSRRQLRAM